MTILPDAEDLIIVSSFIWTKHRNVMDRRTDGQTDLLWILQRSALLALQTRCKKFRTVCSHFVCVVLILDY